MSADLTFDEYNSCQRILFEWADSYDAKEWDRLRNCLAPAVELDYSAILNKKWDAISPADFVEVISKPDFLGNPLVKTQHFIGLASYEKLAVDEVQAVVQLRAAHQRYEDSTLMTVAAKGHVHGTGTMRFKKVEGSWKLAALIPCARWVEYDMSQVFAK